MRVVRLLGAVMIVVSAETEAQLHRKRADHPALPPSTAQLLRELNERRDGVPVVVDHPGSRGDRSLLVHGSTWAMRLFPTKAFRGARRGYMVASIDPLRLRDHHRLAEGYLLVLPRSWEKVAAVTDLDLYADAQYERLLAEWQAATTERQVPGGGSASLPQAHSAFLDRVDRVIDANERITTSAATAQRPFPYRAVKPVGERRHGTHSVYEFVLATSRAPEEDAFVQVRGEQEQRGQVTRAIRGAVTVRFDRPVDWDRIAKVGELELTPSTIVFRKQREAVARLRDGESRNSAVLDVLVDRRIRPFGPAPDRPTIELDPSQVSAFASALGVPDLMVILGPPGTGKTRVISQIANAAAVGGPHRPPQRVLITSHTNRAVDNVLQRLPSDLVVVRVGSEGSVTDEGRPYLLETQVSELRARIVDTVGTTLRRLDDLEVAGKWASELRTRTDELAMAIADLGQARRVFGDVRRAVGGPAQAALDRLTAECRRRAVRLARVHGSAHRAAGRAAKNGLLSRFWRGRHARFAAKAQRLHTEQNAATAALAAAERHLDEVTRDVPAVREAGAHLAAATARVDQVRGDAFTAAHGTRAAVGDHQPPPVREGATPGETHADLTGLLAWLDHWIPLLGRRARLLSEWHAEVSGATAQLHPELVRYADVIAATAIGTASRPELSEMDFGLAIIDEAGQIGTADVLVPLVRARRAVLVGDHQQLPPYLDSEVEVWGKGIDDPAVRTLLSHSALELMVDGLPPTNVVPLTEQRRMPLVIARFISDTFYQGRLGTAVVRDHTDQLFTSPFAFVDTARLPDTTQREQPAEGRDRGLRGYRNPAEARLLVKLAAHYDQLGQDWAVIVPYRAQIKEITTGLVALIGQADKVRLNVGSVDSFQGGERDVILYGFTRSNPDGNVGFLKELRRANVAFTRAKRQLVLVGDLSTLTSARDEPFRNLCRALRDYVARWGDVRQYEEIDAKL